MSNLSAIESRLRALERAFALADADLAQIADQLSAINQAVLLTRQLGVSGTGAGTAQGITALLCNGAVAVGASVSVTGPSSYSASGTTNSSGDFSFTWSTSGSYTVTVTPTDPLYQATSATFTLPGAADPYTINCNPISGYNCFGCCTEPIKSTLHLSDSVLGAVVMAWDSAAQAYWGSQLSGAVPYCTSGIGCPSPVGGGTATTAIMYRVLCASGSWELEVGYSGCTDSSSGNFGKPYAAGSPYSSDLLPPILATYLAVSPTCSPVNASWSPSATPFGAAIYASTPTYVLTV